MQNSNMVSMHSAQNSTPMSTPRHRLVFYRMLPNVTEGGDYSVVTDRCV